MKSPLTYYIVMTKRYIHNWQVLRLLMSSPDPKHRSDVLIVLHMTSKKMICVKIKDWCQIECKPVGNRYSAKPTYFVFICLWVIQPSICPFREWGACSDTLSMPLSSSMTSCNDAIYFPHKQRTSLYWSPLLIRG